MKKYLLCLILLLNLVACAKSNESQETAEVAQEETTEKINEEVVEETTEVTQEDAKTIVIYFSATGTTKGVAEKIAKITEADIYEILAKEEYTSDDLNWHDDNSRTSLEQNDPSSRPEIGSEDVNLEEYSTVYLGYPIWWGEAPKILNTFVEKYNFDTKTIIPFCTSGSSGIGSSAKNLEDLAGSGNWVKGNRFSGSVSDSDLESWINSLN